MKRMNVLWIVGGVLVAAVLIGIAAPLTVRAQAPVKPKRSAATRTPAAVAERPPRDVTLTGKVVSIHAYMTGSADEESPRAVADGLRAGGAAALETETGLVVLGQGNTGGLRVLLKLANEQVEAKGRLYEKGGVKFLDFDTIQAAAEEEEETEEEDAEQGDE